MEEEDERYVERNEPSEHLAELVDDLEELRKRINRAHERRIKFLENMHASKEAQIEQLKELEEILGGLVSV